MAGALARYVGAGLLVVAGTAAFSQSNSNIAAYKSLSLAQLMDVEVTSVSRRPEALADAASSVQVLTGDDIVRAGSRRIPTALRLLANLQVAQVSSSEWAITARGFNNTTTNKFLVQLDGRTLYSPLFAGVFWDVQDTFLYDIDRIEVISGPGATQWGSNAVNGIINITTKSARDTQGALFTGGAGSEPLVFGAARYGGTLAPGLYYRVYGKYTKRDSLVTPQGAEAGDGWHTTQGGFRTDWDRSDSDRITVQGDLYEGRIGQPGALETEVRGGNLIGGWRRTLGPDSEVSLRAYYDYTHREIPNSFTEHLYVYNVDIDHRLPIGQNHNLVWGGAYRLIDDRLRNPATFAFRPAEVTHYWLSGFVQDEVTLHERVRVTGGVKVERNPYTGWEFQPSIRAGWQWRERHLLWGAVSRALRTPSRIDRDVYFPPTAPYTIGGGRNFKSETLLAYELGYRAEVKRGLSFSLATFFHDYDDLRSLEIPPNGLGGVVANGLEGKSYGAEFSADYLVRDGWRLRVGYTEMRVTSRPKAGSQDTLSVRSQSLDPNRIAVVHSQFDVRKDLTLDLTARHVARIGNQDVPAHFAFDLRVAWQVLEGLEVAVTGRNLFDDTHAEFGLPGSRREVERSFNGSFIWRF